MASDFLSNLGDILNTQFETGESKLRTLDIAKDGHVQRYGQLKDFANKFDQSADRSYTEEGSQRTDFYNPKPKQLDILMQDPDVTVLVKKRAFASLAENFRPDLMDEQEKLFYKATKVLFQNKCKQLAAHEKLSKISIISAEIGRVDYHLLPILFSATDALTQIPGAAGFDGAQDSINGTLSKFKSIVNRVREIVALSQDNYYTTWLTNIPDSFRSNFGEGTGVIEFTNISSLSTTTTLQFGKGSFSLNFNDPYELMLITNKDIEQAINDASNRFYNNSFIQLGLSSLDETITNQKRILRLARLGRNVNPISFIVSPDTYLGKRVRAIIDNIGYEINFDASSIGNIIGTNNIDPSAKKGSEALGNDGLNDNEINLFNNIVSMLYNQLSITANSRRQAIADNQDPKKGLNAIRKKLRLHYGNKLLIQPMDNVHIYINSKKKIDSKIIGGLQSSFSAQGFLQGINNLTQNIKDTFNINENYSLEKSIFVGNDFPNWIWQAMRSQFVSDKNGAHVFAGIVDDASSSYSNGVFTVRASGSDNAGYFNYGVVNFKPSVDVFNGGLYDPLTPFKLEFDSSTGALKYKTDGTPELLDENKYIFDSAFVKNKNGLLAGLKPTEKNFSNQDADRIKNNSVRRVFYDPDGMVYRWKEGVATLVLFGDSYESNPSNNQPPAITEDPFAGQDIMNVLSLLITGEPYNFATFYKSAIKFDNFKRDAATNQTPSNSYFRGLQTQLKLKNSVYGNFVPFKQLTMDEASFTKILNNQLNAIKFDAELQDLTQQRAVLADKLSAFGKTTASSLLPSEGKASPEENQAAQRLSGLDQQINDRISKINDELNRSDNPPITIVGDDISFDYDSSDVNSSGSKTRLDANTRKNLRRKLAFLTRRLAWKVRANEDVNFLVVDDTYDKDYDIQAFEKTFTNPTLFKSEYLTVADKINNVINLIRGMEVFANTQGHIEIRNPKYNRMPSSVFYKMLRMKNELGVQIFPQFLEDLFVNQINQLNINIEVLEDEIRLYCLALGNITDADCQNFINSFDANSNRANIGKFQFLSEEATGTIIGGALDVSLQSQPDMVLSSIQTKLAPIESQEKISAFSASSRASFVQSNLIPPGDPNNPKKFNNLSQIRDLSNEKSREERLSARLRGKTGQTFDLAQLFNTTNNATIKLSTVSSVDILQITNGIATRLSARQRAVRLAAAALKNVQEGLTLFNGGGGVGDRTGANAMLFPSLYDSRSIPKVFEHMIEDESYDDLGVGSSKRYVIKNHDIVSYNISEKRPPFTSIEIVGRMGELFVKNNELPQDLNVFQNGNALITAAAVDYDLWRMYGISLPQSIEAPYLSDPNTQCAPYAVSLLNKARKEILGGTIDLVGNEYQQPGEVIYLENRDLLFYVESVSHQFTFGRSFTTSINIGYGHNPGEYIPTFLDVIGKVLYNNKDISNFVHKRQGNVFNQEHIGTIVGNTNTTFNSSNGFGTIEDDITIGPYGDFNRLALQHIIDYAGQTLSLASDNMNPRLELRIYYNSGEAGINKPDIYAEKLQNTIYDYLIGKNDLAGNVKPTADQSSSSQMLSAFESQIKVIQVDSNIKNQGEFRYPSAKSFYYARESVGKTDAHGTFLQQKVDSVIYKCVVDCWVVFNNPAVSKN